jgi:hypothetical protein
MRTGSMGLSHGGQYLLRIAFQVAYGHIDLSECHSKR